MKATKAAHTEALRECGVLEQLLNLVGLVGFLADTEAWSPGIRKKDWRVGIVVKPFSFTDDCYTFFVSEDGSVELKDGPHYRIEVDAARQSVLEEIADRAVHD